eukprot:TRINITY_DN19121_c0_g1_i1.p1 TRINITY_DN19121_c0_g1~~TRINITY_DN19121_c0_g1_i1.p1  ORF type:complete len:535 (-),score=31.17 TRINITY_DN19121_c0_g1_i1:479-2083(-)
MMFVFTTDMVLIVFIYCLNSYILVRAQGEDFACGLDPPWYEFQCSDCELRCADDDCNARQSNIQGEVLILSVNSMYWSGGTPNHPMAVSNPAGCCDKCKETAGCNAWVFCSNEQGCGEGCKEYVASLPAEDGEKTKESFVDLFQPQRSFGEYGPECYHNKWPNLMCTLKKVDDVENPEEVAIDSNEWVSGVLKQTPDCRDGFSRAVCDSCNAAQDIDACYDCASQVHVNEQLNCNRCAELPNTELQKHCTECLQLGSTIGCGQCVSQYLKEDLQSCFECTIGVNDQDAQNGCFLCQYSASDEPDCVSQCVKSDTVPTHAKPECGSCYGSRELIPNPERCVQCLQESTEADTHCDDCKSERCFSCLSQFASNIDGRKGCAECNYLDKTSEEEDCYDCLGSPIVSDYGKRFCKECVNLSDDTIREGCYTCLNGATYSADASSCLDCSGLGDKAYRCYECVAKMHEVGATGLSCKRCGRLDTQEQQSACYQCVEDPGKPTSNNDLCSECFDPEVDNPQQCLSCVVNAATWASAWDCL